MLKVGITGGIGSGKSLVADIFSHMGVPVFYADKEAAVITNTNPLVSAGLMELFGPDVLDADGHPDRKKMREIIFQNATARDQVNKLIHPLVKSRFESWCDQQQHAPFVLFEAAILFESESDKGLNHIVMVEAPETLRLERTMKRDRLQAEQVKAIMKSQMDENEKSLLSDFFIINDEKQLLIPQVVAVYNRLVKLTAPESNVV